MATIKKLPKFANKFRDPETTLLGALDLVQQLDFMLEAAGKQLERRGDAMAVIDECAAIHARIVDGHERLHCLIGSLEARGSVQ